MRVRLVHVVLKRSGARAEREETVEVAALRIGRGTNNELQIPGLAVPLHHCVLEERPDGMVATLADAASLEVNGYQTHGGPLAPGDVLRIGGHQLRVLAPDPGERLALEIEQVERPAPEGEGLARRTSLGVERGLFTRRKLSWAGVVAVLGLFLGVPLTVDRGRETWEALGPGAARSARRLAATWSSGPLASAHWNLAGNCRACHAATLTPVRDDACQACHHAARHQDDERVTPRCASCHVEHRGQVDLTDGTAAECVRCHADLSRAVRGAPALVASDALAIAGFADGHPEFAVWVGGEPPARVRLDATPPPADGTRLRFNHARHLKPGLRGPEGAPTVQLACGDCHQGPMTTAAWDVERWAFAGPAGTRKKRDWSPVRAPELAPAEEPAYFAPISYARHCAACHPHTFDPRMEAAPHDRPEVVRAFLVGSYARWVVAHPDVQAGTPRRRPIYGGARAGTAVSPQEWVDAQVAEAERLLFHTPCAVKDETCLRCQQCHALTQAPDAELPTVVPPRLPIRWLPQSRFDHGAHRLLGCVECHAGVRESTETSDVLLPRIETCRTCHHPGGARDDCAECHTYHGARGPVAMEGKQTIRELSTPGGGG